MPIPKEFVKHGVSGGELAVYEALSAPEVQAQNNGFSTLILPEAINLDKTSGSVTLPYYEGETFNDAWNVNSGGAEMDLSLTRTIPLLLKDLATVETSIFTDDVSLAHALNLVYDHEHAVRYFGDICLGFTNEGVLSENEHVRAIQLLNHPQTTSKIVNNGDFYARNLIRQPGGKLVLIDWETWNPHSPFFLVDHPENVAAVQYVHMWGNPDWQTAFRAELSRVFSFSSESFDKGLVIKALTLASFFRKYEELFDGQIAMLKHLLVRY